MEGDFNTKYVNKHGIGYSCDIHPDRLMSDSRIINVKQEELLKIHNGDTIYVTTSALLRWFSRIYQILKVNKKHIILVTGDSTISAPMALFRNANVLKTIIDDNVIIHWFCQNCDLPTDSPYFSFITPIPLGIDYHSIHRGAYFGEPQTNYTEQDNILDKLSHRSQEYWRTKRTNLLLDAHLTTHTNPTDRQNAYDILHNKPFSVLLPKSLPRTEYWKFMLNYKYIVSPLGKGMDCHRTWEALILGVVPIIKRTTISPLFEGLPIIIVDSYDEITQELLDTYEYPSEFNEDKLCLEYWKKLIYDKKQQYIQTHN